MDNQQCDVTAAENMVGVVLYDKDNIISGIEV